MKKLVFLMVVVLAMPLYAADVDFTLTNNTDGTGTLTYVVNAGDAPVAMGLNVNSISNPVVGVTGIDSFFDVYVDAAYTMEAATPGSYNYGDGSPIAKKEEAGVDALPLSTFCLSIAGLGGAEAPLDDPPDGNPTPVVVGIIDLGQNGSIVQVSANAIRGGVYGYNGPLNTNLPKFASITYVPPTDCVKADAPFYDEWLGSENPATPTLNWAKPDCWCYERNCRADGDGLRLGTWVSLADLNVFLASFNKADFKLDNYSICGDYDHIKLGTRCSLADLNVFLAYFNKADFKVPVCSLDWEDIDGPGPGVGDGDEDYNFWIVP